MRQARINDCAPINVVLYTSAHEANGKIRVGFISAIDKTSLIKKVVSKLKKSVTIQLQGSGTYKYKTGELDYYIKKIDDSNYSSLVLWKKDHYNEKHSVNVSYIYMNIDKNSATFSSTYALRQMLVEDINNTNLQQLFSLVYKKVSDITPIPILADWVPYILGNLILRNSIEFNTTYGHNRDSEVSMLSITLLIEDGMIEEIITNGLQQGRICIKKNAVTSAKMESITGLNQYLTEFSETLTDKIQKSFVPKFDPEKEKISDKLMFLKEYAFWKSGFKMDLFPAQRVVIQAMCKHLDKSRTGILIGEQGSGKTYMGATIVSAHTQKNNTFSVVMCPSHLVKKWKSEILNTQPLSDAIIISSLSELISIDDYIMSKDRKVNLFVIMSKDIAKMDTEHRPAAIWSDRKKTFVCPKCGNPVYRETMDIVNVDSKVPELNANYPELYFITNNRYNCSCKAMTQRFYDSQEEQCNEKLWQPFNKNNTGGWIKTGSGWILKKHLRQVHDRLIENAEKLNKKFSTILSNISIALQQLEEDKYVVRSPRSYPIAKYIKNKYKGVLDYAILDECHQLKGKDSAQGLAAGDLINAANRTLLLTGTLLNGYASGIYYLFFRAFSKTMLNEGFGFNDNNKFQQEYGVTQMTSNQRGSYITTSKKELPGISPIVFTKFMLENSLFIGMSDISEGLPDYQEIPIPVPMDQELRQAYENFANAFRFANSDALTRKTSMQFIQGMLIYSDQPYDQPPIVDYDTDAIVYTPVELDKEKISNKEQALIDLVLRKKAQGEKVLIYYTWTGRTELGPRFVKSLSNVGVKAVELSTNVKAEDRQYWIEEQVKDGIDAFIVNPRKVETGLDLLDFTTIVFYQTGNDSYTLRQASRRSWRLSQANDVEVYFLYYQDTIQETLLNMMATKIQASMAIEGKFSEEGLNAMSQNEDFLTQIATSVVEGITEKVDVEVFQKITTSKKDNLRVEHKLSESRKPTYPIGFTVHSEKPHRRKTYRTSTTKSKDIFAITSLI